MDEIDKRLKEASENCLKYYDGWNKNKKNAEAKNALQEAIHDLRKVASRLEIELAISERSEVTQKPLPIPPHRSNNRRIQNTGDDGDMEVGNRVEPGNGNENGGSEKPSRRRGPKKSEG